MIKRKERMAEMAQIFKILKFCINTHFLFYVSPSYFMYQRQNLHKEFRSVNLFIYLFIYIYKYC